MPGTMSIALLLLLVLAAGLGGYALLVRIGLDDGEAWAGGRTAGLVGVAMVAWWLGAAGLAAWRMAGAALLATAAIWGAWTLWQRRSAWRAILAAEAIVTAGTLLVLLLRLDRPEIMGTEKPMDMGIFATLLRSRGFPPADMWLAGQSLPYYYWGALLWSVPLTLSRLPLEYGYTLVVALIGGLVTGTVWMLGRRLAGSHLAGVAAAFLTLFAGTPDGLRQLIARVPLTGLDYWHSSRQVTDTITEWPLFTLWLGDLHPHLLSMPLQLLAMLVAAEAGRKRSNLPALTVLAALFAATWAANPWAMPPTLVAVALLLIAGDGTWHWPFGGEGLRWLAVPAVAVAGWLLSAPFQLSFHPPFQGIGLAHAWTPPIQLLLYAGGLLVPAFAAAAALLVERLGDDRQHSLPLVLAVFAVATLAAAVSGRPTLVLLVLGVAALAVAATGRGTDPDRPALALAALGLFMLAVPEVLFVRDPYGDQLHRMNTVFKTYIQGWLMLALSAPVLLRRASAVPRRRLVLAVVMVVPALPHLLGMASGLTSGRPLGLDGLRWMDAGDRAMVRFLRRQPPGTTIVEAVGGAYTEYARLAAATGVPAFLGWANHEGVWRGHQVDPELQRRDKTVHDLYSSGDPAAVRAAVAATGADLVAVGRLERRTYPEEGLAAVIAAGEKVFAAEGSVLLRFPDQRRSGATSGGG